MKTRIKVLQVINTLNTAGAERLVCTIAEGMNRPEIQTDVLVLNGVETGFMRTLEAAGVRVIRLGSNEYNPWLIYKLRPYLETYDIVHVHLFPAQYWVALTKYLFKSKAHLVTTEHSTFNFRCKYKLTTWSDRKIYRLYEAITCISPATLNFIRHRAPSSVRTVLIENGIDVALFSQAKSDRAVVLPNVPVNAFVLMQVARFKEEKNQIDLVKVLAQLPTDIHAVFVGDGPMRKHCESLAKDLNVEERAHFLGKREDIPSLLAAADIVVMPSLWEGFGLSAVEGMAAHKPVLASNVAGLAQVVEDESLLFPVNDIETMANRIIKLYKDEDLRKRLGEECYQRAQKYDVRFMLDNLWKLYSQLEDGDTTSN